MLAVRRPPRPPGLACLHSSYIAPALRQHRRTLALVRPAVHLHPLAPAYPALRRRTYATANGSSPEKAVTEKQSSSSKEVSKSKAPEGRLSKVWATIKKEASHYWHGTKLLGKEIRISTRLLSKLVRGGKLTRREHRQLKRTTTDLLRLIPFVPFLVIPFMELLLPVALKIFPNMLPSTFEDKYKEEEKKRKLLKVRLEMAKFLQETLRESGLSNPEKIRQSEEFKEFFRKVRSTGEKPSTDDIVKVAKLFEDDLTIDNLSRPQLVSMCRYLNINAFGTDNFLRYTIRNRMKHLKNDDRVIDAEGITALSPAELQQVCQSRAIRTIGVSEDRLRQELEQWIDLHLHRGLSGTLLVLGRAFAVDRNQKIGDKPDESHLMSLKDTLASLPDSLLNEAEMEVNDTEASYKRKLEVLEEQESLIEDEAEQEEREEASRKAKKEAEEKLKAESAERAQQEKEKAKAESMLPSDQAEAVSPEDSDVRMTSEQLAELGEALSILSARSSVLKERQDLAKLMEDFRETEEESGEATSGLAKRIKSMIQKVDKQIGEYDSQVDTMRRERIQVGEGGKIAVHDLRRALEVIRHRPSDESIAVLCDKLDVDRDGFVPLDHVVSLANEEGLGIIINEDTPGANLIEKGRKLREEGDNKRPKKEDLVDD